MDTEREPHPDNALVPTANTDKSLCSVCTIENILVSMKTIFGRVQVERPDGELQSIYEGSHLLSNAN